MSDINFSISAHNSYSQAFYELAEEGKMLDKIENQVSEIVKLISQSSDFISMIKNPTLRQEDQYNIINLIFERFKLCELFKRFVNFLILKRRLFYIENILKDFLAICSKNRGEIEAKLISAKKLNETEIEKIKSELSINFGKNIKLNYKLDESIIGGLIIQVGSIMIDSSIRSKLQKIQSKMIEA